jgi:purine-binding chemotaxis protein CheW
MDIVQARKKAREKAEQEEKARRQGKEAPAQAAEPAPALPPPKKARPAEAAKSQRKPKQEPAATTPKPPVQKAQASSAPGPAKPRAFAPPPPAPAKGPPSEEDIFVDMSFGEDLPLPPDEDADFELGALPPRPPEKPAPRPAPPAPPQAATQEPRPEPKPAPPRLAKESAAPKPPPAALGPDLDTLGSEKDDFLELVSEDLYRREFGEETQKDLGEQLELISFQLAQESYAIRLTLVQQIIKMREITPVPRAPEYILGVISLRGVIIPVFDLRRRLGLARREHTRETRIIVVREGAKSIGLIVDRVRQVVRIPAAGIEPPPPILGGLEAEYLEGIGRSEGRMLILLHLEKVLAPPTMH